MLRSIQNYGFRLFSQQNALSDRVEKIPLYSLMVSFQQMRGLSVIVNVIVWNCNFVQVVPPPSLFETLEG